MIPYPFARGISRNDITPILPTNKREITPNPWNIPISWLYRVWDAAGNQYVILYPFSFCELLKFKEIEPDIYSTGSIARIKNALKEYMDVGGFPEVYLFQKEMAARIYEDIIYKDIISRHDIRTAIPVLSLTAFFWSYLLNF